MAAFRLAVALVATFHLQCFSSTTAQNLTAVKCAVGLPVGGSRYAILYDKYDNIYIFGGRSATNYLEQTVEYSVSRDTTKICGVLPYTDYAGVAVMDKSLNMFYLAGQGGDDILQYDTYYCRFTKRSSFAEGSYWFATVTVDMDTALLFGTGPAGTNITRLNLNTRESTEIGEMPEALLYPSAIWLEEENVAYIFDGPTVFKYWKSSNRTEKLSAKVPIKSNHYGAVWDGRYGYLIGEVSNGSPAGSLVRFDTETESFSFIPVEGYVPVDYATAVYVEKVNRIYMFGGIEGSGGSRVYHDEIWYIDLSPLNP